MMNKDFDLAETVAMFIAAALQHPVPRCNSRQPRVSTIEVSQHKNKFGQAVVYCDLADNKRVREMWEYEKGKTTEPTVEFLDKCLLHDAIHYRRCYMKMLFLVPEQRSTITARADYHYLLFDTFQDLEQWVSTDQFDRKWYHKFWNVDGDIAWLEKLRKVYDLTF